jgi:hypothetical protein
MELRSKMIRVSPCKEIQKFFREDLSKKNALFLGLFFSALVLVRVPPILLKGRFWAEEGSKFFENAWLLPWPKTLLAPWGGYLNITANLAGLLAWKIPPLEWAPYATTAVGFIFQICPAILLLTSGIPWLRRNGPMAIALMILLLTPFSDEVWLSSIASQVHLTLCCALILAFAAKKNWVEGFRFLLLGLAVLSGPAVWLLTPLFVIRTLIDRSWRRAVQTAVLVSGIFIQLGFFYSHEAGRSYAIQPLLFLDMAFTKHILIPFFGPSHFTKSIIASIHQSALDGQVPIWPAIIFVFGFIALLRVLKLNYRSESFWMLMSAGVLIAGSYVGSLGSFVDMFMSIIKLWQEQDEIYVPKIY